MALDQDKLQEELIPSQAEDVQQRVDRSKTQEYPKEMVVTENSNTNLEEEENNPAPPQPNDKVD